VTPDGQVEWCRIQAVHRAEVPWETIVAIDTTDGTLTTTAGHRVFTSPTTKVEAKDLVIGDAVLTSDADGRASTAFVIDTRIVTSRHFMYDLTAERWHNFTLHGCNVVVSNSPDRNYKFRPPQGEGTVGCYNRVFGYIWEDEELAEYLEIALWKWNAHPPETEELCNIDTLCQRKPAWKAALLWGALVNAAQALAYNWVSEEFSYSIGGISLDLDRSSKYMDLKRNAEEQWDKLTEAKSRTTKYIRGLQQPRFGIGIRSAFGPATGRGVLSPRNFLAVLLAPSFAAGYCSWVQEVAQHAHSLSSLFA
jgi:hypothetical protein